MYTTNMTHFLNEDGNIAKDAPSDARELGNFLAFVIDAYTQRQDEDKLEVRCFNKNCHGVIAIGRGLLTDEIIWDCPDCCIGGVISEWRGTKWNNNGNILANKIIIDQEAITRVKRLNADLVFPIHVTPDESIRNDFPDDDELIITKIHDYVENYGLIVVIQTKDRLHLTPVYHFTITDEESTNYKLIEEFLDWWYASNEDDLDLWG